MDALITKYYFLPHELQSKILYYLLSPHPNVIILKKSTLVLTYTRRFLFLSDSYKDKIWNYLRPSNLGKTFYGSDNSQFLIIRNKISVREVLLLIRT